MSNIIDLSTVVSEPIVLKFSEDETFTIPAEPSVELVYQIVDFEDKLSEAKTNKQQFDGFVKMVSLILKQDKEKKVTQDFVRKNLHLTQMRKIVEIYQKKVLENQNNPN